MLLGSFKFIKAIHFQCKKLKKKKKNMKIRSTTRHKARYIQGQFGKNILKSSVSGWRCGPVKEFAQ